MRLRLRTCHLRVCGGRATNTSDHLPILARMELYLQPQGTSNSEIPPNIPHSKLNWAKLSSVEIEIRYTSPMEVQLSKMGCPTLKEFLHNPAAIDQHLATLTSLMLDTANNSIPSSPRTKNRGGMRKFAKLNMLPNRPTNDGELQANPGTHITLCASTTNP